MAGKNTAAFAIFPTRAAAESAVDQLVAAGFSQQDISALMADNTGSRDFAAEKNTKAPEGTTTGATVGGVVGGTLGLLAGLGALAIPGVGPLIAAGPIMGALAGLGAGGAVGGLVGALVGLGIPEYEAKRYEGRVKDGGILVSVHCDSSEEVSRAKDILKQAGGEDVASAGEKSVSTHTANSDRKGVEAVRVDEYATTREDVVVNDRTGTKY
jgi:rhodanese-related sulfurtransferase